MFLLARHHQTMADTQSDKNQEASVAGAVAAAHYIRSIAPGKNKVFAILIVSVFEMPHRAHFKFLYFRR
jgi:hypothetical protein